MCIAMPVSIPSALYITTCTLISVGPLGPLSKIAKRRWRRETERLTNGQGVDVGVDVGVEVRAHVFDTSERATAQINDRVRVERYMRA